MIIINFKNYKSSDKAIDLAKKIEKYLPKAVVSVPATEIRYIADKTGLKVFAQHLDGRSGDRATGFLLPSIVKKVNCKGSLLNHSEHPLEFEDIKMAIQEMKKEKLESVICVSTVWEAEQIKSLKPNAIAFEDQELIASGKSITKYKSGDIKRFAGLFKGSRIIPLCGAGIHSASDIIAARKLGCRGVLIASAIAKAKNPDKLLKDIAKLKIK